MEPETKKTKFIRPPPRRFRAGPSPPEKSDPAAVSIKPNLNMAQSVAVVVIDPRVQHAKNHAISQAQQDGSKANFRASLSPMVKRTHEVQEQADYRVFDFRFWIWGFCLR